jgi:hypothetical protein
MATNWTGFGLGTLMVALSLGAVAPASAEFFGCNDKPGKVLFSTGGAPRYATQARVSAQHTYARVSARYTHELAAQASRPRITIQPRQMGPGPNSKRVCRSWLAKEYRVSGTVIVPRQQCWWQ